MLPHPIIASLVISQQLCTYGAPSCLEAMAAMEKRYPQSASAETFVRERIKFAFCVLIYKGDWKVTVRLNLNITRKPFFSSSPNTFAQCSFFLTHPFCPFPFFHPYTSPSRLMASLSCSKLTYISTARFRAPISLFTSLRPSYLLKNPF